MRDALQDKMTKFYAKTDKHITVNAVSGHFATIQSHINYYIDVTRLKIRLNESKEAAKSLCQIIRTHMNSVDTIVCMDDCQVLGAALADEMEKAHFSMNNAHETMYVVSPEQNNMQQLVFRNNVQIAIEGKNVLILMSNITTGNTVNQAVRTVKYYGGTPVALASIFSMVDVVGQLNVYSLFSPEDFPGYSTYQPYECPMCAAKKPVEALVSGAGYSLL